MEVEQTPAPELVRRPSLFPLVACYTERLTTATTTVQEMLKGVRYGFNNQYSGLFSQIQEEVRSHCNKLYAQLLSGAQRSPTGRAHCIVARHSRSLFVCRRQRSWSCPVPTPLPPANGESCGY